MNRFLLVAFIASASLCGCAFDHRKDVAYNLLYKPDGFEEERAFAAAISARFPAGTSVSELQQFAESSKGKCWSRKPDAITCEIATRGKFCSARLIKVEATLEGSFIKSVGFLSGGLGC